MYRSPKIKATAVKRRTDRRTRGRPLYPIPAAVRLRRQFPSLRFLLRGLARRRVVVPTEQIGGCSAICGTLRDGKGEAHTEAACRTIF